LVNRGRGPANSSNKEPPHAECAGGLCRADAKCPEMLESRALRLLAQIELSSGSARACTGRRRRRRCTRPAPW
jgi:hypothetical protein